MSDEEREDKELHIAMLETIAELIKDRGLTRLHYKTAIEPNSITYFEIDTQVKGLSRDDEIYFENECEKFRTDSSYQGYVEPSFRLKKNSERTPKKREWIIPNILPLGKNVYISGSGGTGKTSLICDLITGLTTGERCILDSDKDENGEYVIPLTRKPAKVLYITSEEDIEELMPEKLYGVNNDNFFSIGQNDEGYRNIVINEKCIEPILKVYQPLVVIFDPLQSFLDENVNMINRKSMRNATDPIGGLAMKYRCTFIFVMHTNKSKGASGRDRMSDSTDIFDEGRCVFMTGQCKRTNNGEDVFYLSHEKSNGSKTRSTILYTIDDGHVVFKSTTWKKDDQFVREKKAFYPAASREQARDVIMTALIGHGESMREPELKDIVLAKGISEASYKREKAQMKKDELIKYFSTGTPKDKKWYVQLVQKEEGEGEGED